MGMTDILDKYKKGRGAKNGGRRIRNKKIIIFFIYFSFARDNRCVVCSSSSQLTHFLDKQSSADRTGGIERRHEDPRSQIPDPRASLVSFVRPPSFLIAKQWAMSSVRIL